MKTSSKACLALAAALCVAVGAPGAGAQEKKLPNIVILATGGTIAGAAATGTQSGYTSGAVTIDAMLQAVPGIKELANVKGEQISNVGSQDMSFDIMLKLANRINELAPTRCRRVRDHPRHRHHGGDRVLPEPGGEDRQAGGAGGLHAALHRGQRGRPAQPLQRRGCRRRSQGPRARRAAGHERLDPRRSLADQDQHHRGADVHVAGARAWSGVAAYGKNDFYSTPPWKHTTKSEFSATGVTKLPRVDIIYGCADMSPDLIDAAAANGAKGIVIAGVGNGNMNKASLDAAARVAKSGVVVVRSSRVATGNVGRNVEVNDDELNLIASDELNPQKARVLLSLALLKTRTPQDLQRLFNEY